MIGRILNRVLAPFGYAIMRRDRLEALSRERDAFKQEVERRGVKLKETEGKLKKLNRRLDERNLELEETRLKLQRALRSELEQYYATLK